MLLRALINKRYTLKKKNRFERYILYSRLKGDCAYSCRSVEFYIIGRYLSISMCSHSMHTLMRYIIYI